MSIHSRFAGLRWRWRLSLAQGIVAGLLLAVAAGQRRAHDDWLDRTFPERLPEMDLAYIAPAELIAVALNGPGVLPHFWMHIGYWMGVPPEPKFETPIRLLAVCSFWFIAGLLIDRRSRKQSPGISSSRLIRAGNVIGAITCGLLTLVVAKGIINDIMALRSLNFFGTYIRIYGWSAAMWTELALLVWFAALSSYFGGASFARHIPTRQRT